jgi:hypothetical protein
MAVQKLSDRHDALPCLLTGGSATGLPATGAWLMAAVGDAESLCLFHSRVCRKGAGGAALSQMTAQWAAQRAYLVTQNGN